MKSLVRQRMKVCHGQRPRPGLPAPSAFLRQLAEERGPRVAQVEREGNPPDEVVGQAEDEGLPRPAPPTGPARAIRLPPPAGGGTRATRRAGRARRESTR